MPPTIALAVGIRAGSDFSCDDVTQCPTKHKAAAEESVLDLPTFFIELGCMNLDHTSPRSYRAADEMVSYSAHMLTVVANVVIQDIGAAVRIMPKWVPGSMM